MGLIERVQTEVSSVEDSKTKGAGNRGLSQHDYAGTFGMVMDAKMFRSERAKCSRDLHISGVLWQSILS